MMEAEHNLRDGDWEKLVRRRLGVKPAMEADGEVYDGGWEHCCEVDWEY